jgi:hypothetical protein
MEEMRNTYITESLEVKILGQRRRCEDDIRINLKEIAFEDVDWI